MIEYSVQITLPDARTAKAMLTWLDAEHLAAVCAAGALDARVIRPEPKAASAAESKAEPIQLIARYRFASRAAFAEYEREHAPALRAEGLARFPPESGVLYGRSVADIVAEAPTRD